MSEPFMSEIRIMSFAFAPKGWALCNGQLLPINQYQALFSLLRTTFGGDGRTTFGLPNFQGRTSMHVGNGHILGERAGEQSHTLTIPEMPMHAHFVKTSTVTTGTTNLPAGNVLTNSSPNNLYGPVQGGVFVAPATIGNTGGGQAHQNMQPFLTLSFCIALVGL